MKGYRNNIEKMIEEILKVDYKIVDKNNVAMEKAFLATPKKIIAYLSKLYGAAISEHQIAKILKGIEKNGSGIPYVIPFELRTKMNGAETWFALTNGDAFCVSAEKFTLLENLFSEEWEAPRTVRYVPDGVAILAKKAAEYAAKKENSEELSKESNIPSYILEIFGPEWGEELEKMEVRFADDERRWVKSDLTSFFDFEAIPWLHRRRAMDLVKGSAFTSNRAKRHFCRVIKKADPAVSWNIAGWLWYAKCQCH